MATFFPRRSVLLSLLALLFSIDLGFGADLTQEQVLAAKAATGLLVTSDGTATAFCVSDSGIFVTCAHAVDQVDEKTLAIVISPASKDEKRYPAKVLRRLKDDDLAVLKIAPDRPLSVLQPGNVAGLFETQPVFAFGYPFGKALAADEKSFPSISVNTGRITSLRMKNDHLDVIQLDAQLNPGNSGGPVLDSNGKVIGIVAAGVVASGINFAIPVSQLIKATDTPVVSVEAPKIKSEQRAEPAEFTVSVDWIFPSSKEPSVAIELRGEGSPRRVDAVKGQDGRYRAQIVPVPDQKNSKKARLTVTLEFAGGTITGAMADLDLSISGKPVALHTMSTLQRTAGGKDFMANGKTIGALPELEALKLDLGGTSLTVDGRKANRIDIQKPSSDQAPLYYKAVVTAADGKVYPSEEKLLAMNFGQSATVPLLEGKVDLKEAREIALPGPIDDVVAAQDGRVLLLHLREIKKIAVFDVLDLKIRGYINLSDDRVFFAGGSKYIFVVEPVANLAERYSVESLQRERTINSPFGNVKNLAMGYSSPSTAVVFASNAFPQLKVTAFDLETMAAVATDDRGQVAQLSNSELIVRASGDGRTFGCSRRGSSPSGFSVLTLRDNVFSLFYEHESPGILMPNSDGSQIFTSQAGIYTNKYVPVLKASGNWMEGTCFIPSYHPMYFLGIPYSERAGRPKQAPAAVEIYLSGTGQALLQVPEALKGAPAAASEHRGRPDEGAITLDKRYHFYPQLDLLLTIPPTNDKIVARPIDVRRLLDEKGIDYLYVTSVPPPAKVSTPYRYKLVAAAKGGGVTFALQSGPTGLTISSDGNVAWNTPAQPVEESVIVLLKTASGQELMHTFRIAVTQ